MKDENDVFGKFEDETGEEYYCPLNTSGKEKIDAAWATVNCVEVTTAGRYSGNLNVVDRFNS